MVASSNGHYEELTGGNLIAASVLLLVAGFITVVVSILGFCGVIVMWKPILLIVSSFINP